ncbi:MAG: DNA mismatch repair protein, partial [Arcobacteraceae bacterium]|nr:DNA mismatch repair protein [Arcobacteraceae bacterium]
NNALEQLNILESSHQPSLFNLINNTSTAMGKRLLKERLSHPIKDEDELNARYKLSKDLYDYHMPIENSMGSIYDIERLARRIKLNRLHPFELSYLYDSLFSIKEVISFTESYNFIKSPCSSDEVNIFMDSISNTFELDIGAKFMLKDISTNMIKPNIDDKIDTFLKENEELEDKLNLFREHILELLGTADSNFVTINRLDKEGFYIQLTKNRYSSIKDKLLSSHIIIDDELYLFKDFNIKVQTTNVKISNRLTSTISDKYVHNLRKIIELNKIIFQEQIEYYDKKFSETLNELVNFIAEVDVTISNIKTAKKNNYICPVIIKTPVQENFIELIQSRHPIIESGEENGIF